LALGYSETVCSFIKEASRSKKIAVLVTENAPQKDGIKMVDALLAANIQVTLIPDAAIFVFMPKISKVVIGARTGTLG
jgi:translation initiation factor 2B subunit (eIF-2B alpha/beta/delta family)